jgi:hypothetical protein
MFGHSGAEALGFQCVIGLDARGGGRGRSKHGSGGRGDTRARDA